MTLGNMSVSSGSGPRYIVDDVVAKSNTDGGQRNLIGYSYGSTIAAQSTLKLANSGQVVDNLILVGSPISTDSPLYKELAANDNIKNIVRIDIQDDPFSNGIHPLSLPDINNHFIFTENSDGQQDELVKLMSFALDIASIDFPNTDYAPPVFDYGGME